MVKDIPYDKKSLVTFDTSDHDKQSNVKDDHLHIDNCQFPWHLIRQWEIKCYDDGLTWKRDLIMLDDAFGHKIDVFKRELESIQQTKEKNVKIISIQEEKGEHDHKTQETSNNNIKTNNNNCKCVKVEQIVLIYLIVIVEAKIKNLMKKHNYCVRVQHHNLVVINQNNIKKKLLNLNENSNMNCLAIVSLLG